MAKSKNTTRLFEVMQASRSKGKGLNMSTPSWWFKRHPRGLGTGSAPPSPLPPVDVPVEVVEKEETHAPPAPRTPGVDLKLDRDKHQIHFKVTYTNVILTAFAVVVIVSLAYVFGKSGHTSPAPAFASEAIEQVKKKPANAKVMEVGPKPSKTSDPDDANATDRSALVKPNTASKVQVPIPGAGTQQTFIDVKRVTGRNYIIVQIYPTEASAVEVKALLDKNGIATTVVNGLSNYANRSWWCVVTLAGFDKIRGNPEYDAFLKKINTVGEQFNPSSKFKKLQPLPYKWRGD